MSSGCDQSRLLRGRVVSERANPLVPGGVQIAPVPGARIAAYRVTRSHGLVAGRYDLIAETSARITAPDDARILATLASRHDTGRVELLEVPGNPAPSDADGWFSVPCRADSRAVLGCHAEGFRSVFLEVPRSDSLQLVHVVLLRAFVPQVPSYVIPME